MTIISIDTHRNGITGHLFHPIIFTYHDGATERRMLGIVFDARGHCAVLDLDLAAQGDIRFTHNAWAGAEGFEDALRNAIHEYDHAPSLEQNTMRLPADGTKMARRLHDLADILEEGQE